MANNTQTAVVVVAHGDDPAANLEVVQLPRPVPGPGEALVQVRRQTVQSPAACPLLLA